METLNLTVPTSWAELSQHQLLHVFTCIAAGYNATQIKTCALIRWNGIDVLAMDTWRALTEQDAQAREYDEMKRNSK